MSTSDQMGIPDSGRRRIGRWLDERLGLSGIRYAVPEHANSLPYLLGGISLFGFLILIVSGIYLAQFYHPHPADAHQSVVYIITGVTLGDLVRSIHFWTAQLVTLTVLLHMLRVLFTASYKRPRELNWYVGLGLLAVTLGLVFTGSVLKSDQEAIEALAHNTEAAALLGSLGGWFSAELSRSVPLLTRLFDAHATILPLLFVLLITAHVYLIKQHGISPKVTREAETRATANTGESHFDIHLKRMVGYGLLAFGIVLILSLLFPAPLGQLGVAGVELTKPWWMFLWLFPSEAMLGTRALIVVPAILIGLLALVPILDRSPYISPLRRKALLSVAVLILIIIFINGVVAALQPVAEHLD